MMYVFHILTTYLLFDWAIVNIYIILCQIYYDLENDYYDNC